MEELLQTVKELNITTVQLRKENMALLMKLLGVS